MPPVLVSSEEYLATSYEGTDREYVRGEVVERSVPGLTHGSIQGLLVHRFWPLHETHGLWPCSEVRMRLALDLYRIPDVAVFVGSHPLSRVPDEPPLVVIEIVSRDDRYAALLEKLEEFRRWGVGHIWVIDPMHRQLAVYDRQGLLWVPQLSLPGYPLEITPESLFGDADLPN